MSTYLPNLIEMFPIGILLIIGIFQQTKGFEFGFKYCKYKCGGSSKEKVNYNINKNLPKAYYWRDFHGMIPPDAYSLGSPNQSPQSYIGLVFDSKNGGVYATTIFEGTDYVYNVNEGNVSKITKHIQILCLSTPTDFAWFNVTKESLSKLAQDGFRIIEAGYNSNAENYWLDFHYITKTTDGSLTYAGVVDGLLLDMEYVMGDGTPKKTNNFTWLMYKPNNTKGTDKVSSKSYCKPFFSHQFNFRQKPGSFIPQFHNKIDIGPCSVICTNTGKKKTVDQGKTLKLSTSLAYYWQPEGVIDKEVLVPAGRSSTGTISYIGQGQAYSDDYFDVGSSDLKGAYIFHELHNALERNYYHVLGSNNQEKLQWVNSTTEDFPKLDKNRLIPGGLLSNGTESYVCRNADYGSGAYFPGSARILPTGTLCFSSEGPENTFEVLMYKPN